MQLSAPEQRNAKNIQSYFLIIRDQATLTNETKLSKWQLFVSAHLVSIPIYIVPLLENYAFDVLYKVYSYSFASIFSAIENIFKLKGKTQP